LKLIRYFGLVLILLITLMWPFSVLYTNTTNPATTTEGNVPPDSSKPTCDFNWFSQWRDKARMDEEFIEMVIGLDNSTHGYNELLNIIAEKGGKVANTIAVGKKLEAVVANVPLKEAPQFLSQASKISRYIEPNLKFQLNYVPNDPSWSLQWGASKIQADYAWNMTRGERSILVAVIDTGIDWKHPDLTANYVPLGYDWTNDDPDPMDDHGHGTHVAGIISAVINNSLGIAGLAQVQIMAEKALDRYGYGYEDDLANAIIHAVDQGAHILSNSWGGDTDSQLIHNAIKYAYDRDVLIIAAAGNMGTSQKMYPAAYPEVIAVTATDESDRRASFSSFGDWVELAAPGVDIYSTVLGYSYGYKSGTSMAAPHVSGVAALIWSCFPNLTSHQVRLHLRHTADDLGNSGFDVYYGYGRVNARKALETGLPNHDLMILDWVTPPYVEPMGVGFINTTVFNFGISTETDIVVQLLVNDTPIDTGTIEILESGAKATTSFSWNPTEIGTYNVTSYVVPSLGEANVENNRLATYIHVGFPLRAVVLDSAGTDYDTAVWQELNLNWEKFGNQMIYVDYTTLNKDNITYGDIVSSRANALIISNAFAWEFTDSEIEAITRYVLEGHGLIATSGTFHYYTPNNNKLAPLFGLNESIGWDVAFTDLLHIQEPTHQLFAGVPNPYVFRDVGGTVPDDGIWDSSDLTEGAYVALGHYKECAIVVHKGLVYISPWLEIIPSYYQFHLQLFYNAIVWSRYQRPEHELIVDLKAPPALNPGKSVMLDATVFNMGLNNETDVELQLLINGTIVASHTIPQLPDCSNYTLSYLWTPTAEGSYDVSAYALPVYGEDNIVNNKKEAIVLVHQLIFAIFKNFDPWGFKANEEALASVGIPHLVFGSKTFGLISLEVFSKVIIASDQDQSFYNDMARYRWWFEDYVNNSGGMLEIHAADGGLNGGYWASFLPGNLTWVRFFSNYVTISDPLHPIINVPNPINNTQLDEWSWTSHGYFTNYPNNANIIIREDSGGRPAYLAFKYGIGAIVATSLTMEWAYEKGYSRILENSLVYRKYQHELMVFLEAPANVRLGDSKWLNITVYNRGLNTETDVELLLLINGTLTNSTIISQLSGDTSFNFSCLWTPLGEGTYNITAYAPPVLDEANIENNAFMLIAVVGRTIPGDINGDGRVDYKDLFLLAKAYGTDINDPAYDPNADLNDDGKIDYEDLFVLAKNYGK